MPLKLLSLCFVLSLSCNCVAQGVLASGVEPAWILDWDGQDLYTLFIGEDEYSYELVADLEPLGSSSEIAETWVFKGERGRTATLVIEFFDPTSAESCPCYHDFGEGFNAGKAYFITERQEFYIGCADYVEVPLSLR